MRPKFWFGTLILLSSLALHTQKVGAQPQGPLESSIIAATQNPRGWEAKGKVAGLLGDDWFTKKSSHTISYCRQADLPYVDEVVEGLEASYSTNSLFLGITPPLMPLEFYFCPMDQPAHMQPLFTPRLGGMTRFAGVALSGTKMCCVNLGNARLSQPYPPWQMAETARHEMNHLFAFHLKGQDRNNSWGWLYEALAETVEDTVKPKSSQMNLSAMKSFMRGYKAVDANWKAMVNERNAQDQEVYRDYEKLLMSIVMFLQDKYGPNCIPTLMKNCRGGDLEESFVKTFGVGTAELEKGWRDFYSIR